jgi:hypothetical protein
MKKIPTQVREALTELSEIIHSSLPDDVGFVLLVLDRDRGNFYTSNLNEDSLREEVITFMDTFKQIETIKGVMQ